jgi:hypothetical protein
MAQNVAIVQAAATAALAGTTDFTSSGFGTPTGALLIGCNASSGTNPAAEAILSIGFWDATNQRAVTIVGGDNLASTNTARSSNDARAVMFNDAAANLAQYSITNITDGIRLTMDVDTTSATRYVTAILFSGVSIAVGNITPNATLDATTESASLGFAPEFIFFASVAGDAADEDKLAGALLSFGLAEIGGFHRSWGWTLPDAAAAETALQRFDDDRCVGLISAASGLEIWAGEVTTWGADTFTLTTRDAANASAHIAFFMALGGADLSYDTISFDTRTTTGDTVIPTDVTPQAALLSICTRSATGLASDATANGVAFGFKDAAGQFSHNCSVEDAADPTNCNSAAQTAAAIDLDSSSGGTRTDLCSGTAVLNASDITLTYTVVDGTARKGFGVVFGEAGAPPAVNRRRRLLICGTR